MPRPNILFIAVDDLRTALGCYGDPNAITPNIDRLAERSMVFQNAYCQQAVCNPSRASLMTGFRPDTIKVWDLKSHFRQEVAAELRDLPQFTSGTHFRQEKPEVVTLPQYLRQHGYHAQSIGKIYHGSPEAQDPESWSVPETLNVVWKNNDYLLPENQTEPGKVWPGPKMAATEAADVADDAYGDGKVADAALRALAEIKDRSFFLAVGFRKPHLPFSAPLKYWNLYDPDKISSPDHPEKPRGIPDYAWHNSQELRGYADIPKEGPLSEALIRKLRHGYYACVSYMDAQVGKLLDALDEYHLTDNTAVVLWGDHGYHLGEKALWCKTTNYELDTRAPLILSVPGRAAGTSAALTEFVDIYPTLIDACGLPHRADLEGVSLLPLFEAPDRPWKQAAFSQFPRPWTYRGEPEVMGYTMRTAHFRYTEWVKFRTGESLACELYDHRADEAEIHNVADDPAYAKDVESLSALLHQGWRAALPPEMKNKFL
ncbi:MAG: sulfatase-like hydrolase/transferase [Chloroflexi bacterium]|nr:sulfatase-like hydrolase/transferase [Chloroflexota bacterium]